MPLDESDLTDAPLTDMLGACKGVLQKVNRGDIYEYHIMNTERSERASVTHFFEALARLPLDDQQKCFDAVVAFLQGEGLGLEHVANRLVKGKRNYLSELKLR